MPSTLDTRFQRILMDYTRSCYRRLPERNHKIPQEFWLTQVQGVNAHYSAVTDKLLGKLIAQQEEGKTGLKSLDAHETHSFTPDPKSQNRNTQDEHKKHAWLCVSTWKV